MPDRAVTCRAMPAVAPDSAYALATDAPAREFPVLTTAADPSSELFKRNDAAHRELVADLRAQMLWAAQGGPEPARQRHLARGKLLPRQRVDQLLDPGSPFLELSPLAAFGMYGDECPAARHHHRRRAGIRAALRDRSQRRHGQGRHLLPHHRQEASAGAGGRPREPAALHLPGGLRRRLLARSGRGVSRPRAFRPHLLQPGHPVGLRHPPDRRRARLVHRRGRLRAGHERRNRHRRPPGDHLPRRSAPGESGDR